MKIQKLNDDVHQNLKNHLKDTSVFMQSYVEYLINDAIEKGIVYAMQDKIDIISEYISIEKTDKKKGTRFLLKTHKRLVNTNAKFFEIIPEDKKIFNTYMEGIIEFIKDDNLYFNLPNYNNVINPKVEPTNLEGVIQYIRKNDDNYVFRLLGGIKEDLKNTINLEKTGKYNLNLKCEIKLHNTDLYLEPFDTKEAMSRTLNDDYILKETITAEKEKYNLAKHKNRTSINFANDFIDVIQKNSNNIQSLYYTEDCEYTEVKIFNAIQIVSNLIAVNSRIGTATHAIIPVNLIGYILESLDNPIKLSECSHDIEHILTKAGSLNGIKIFINSQIDNIYVYRSCMQTLHSMYSYDTCDVDELCLDFVLDSDSNIYEIEILKEYNVEDINKNVINKLNDYDFINIDDTYSPYNLEPFKFKLSSKNINYTHSTGLDLKMKSLNVIHDEIYQDLSRKSVLLDSEYLTKEIKFYGNENRKETHETFLNIIKEYSRFDNTSIVVNALIGSVFMDMSIFKIVGSEVKNVKGSMYKIGTLDKHSIYVDPYMRYDDKKILIMNDIQLKYSKNILINAFKSENEIEINTAFKFIKDITIINITDNEYVLI